MSIERQRLYENVLRILKKARNENNLFLKKMKLLTKEQQESYENANTCYICKGKFENKYLKDKKYHKIRDHCYDTEEYRGAVHNRYNLKDSVPKKFLKVFIMDLILNIILS